MGSSIVVTNVFLVGEMFAFMKGEEDDLVVGDMAAVGITVATKVIFVASKYQRDPE
jgi:hypothetical protein